MKSLFILLFFASFSLSAQETISFQMGSEKITFDGTLIFDGSPNEKTYYHIADGVFHYYYLNSWEGKHIDYVHLSCPVKSIDTKSATTSVYDPYGLFMTINTKKMAEDVMSEKMTDNALTGPSQDENISKSSESDRSMTMVINSQEVADQLLKLLH